MKGRFSRRPFSIACLIILTCGIVFTETHHKLPFFRLLTFTQVFLGFAILTTACSNRLQSTMLVITACVFGLVVVEAVGNWVLSRRGAEVRAKDQVRLAGDVHREAGRPASPPFDAKSHPDPQPSENKPKISAPKSRLEAQEAELFAAMPGVGWRLAGAGDHHVVKIDPVSGKTIYDVHYTIDDHLDRTTISSDRERAVVFLGDSLTFGSGVDDSQTMPQRFSDLLDRTQRVVNLGVPGYSPAQVLFQLQNGVKSNVIGPHPVSLVMLTGPYHASRIGCIDAFTNAAPRYVAEGGKLTYKGACYSGVRLMWREFLDNSASYQAFVAPLTRRVNQTELDLYVDLIAEVSAVAQRMYGVKLLVPFVQFPANENRGVLEKLRAKAIDAIDVTLKSDPASGKNLFIEGDGHPTAYAHDMRAKMIKDALEARNVPLGNMADAP